MNARPLWVLLLLSLYACSGTALAIGVADSRYYACISGNCRNGTGTLRDGYTGVDYTGSWQQGQSVPGVAYEARYGAMPDRTFHMTFAADGLPQEGDQVRSMGDTTGTYKPGVYSGTFDRTTNPFVNCGKPACTVATFGKGTYDNGLGMTYNGNFAYFPVQPAFGGGYVGAGIFMFVGQMKDAELDEESFGLFFSDETMAGMPIRRFVPGRPDYIAFLKKKYQFDLVRKSEESAQQAEESKRRLQMFVGTVLSLGRDAMQGKSMSDMTMNVLKGAMHDDPVALDWAQGLKGQLGDSLNIDQNPVAASLLNSALDKALDKKPAAGALAPAKAAPVRKGYAMAPYAFSCDGSASQTIDIPYKSATCLEAKKGLARASACNLVEELPKAYKACEAGCGPRLPNCQE